MLTDKDRELLTQDTNNPGPSLALSTPPSTAGRKAPTPSAALTSEREG